MKNRFTPIFAALVLTPLIASALSPIYTGFVDVPGDAWYAAYVADAVSADIVSGYKDQWGNPTGKFGPQNPVTFAEALKISLASANFTEDMGVGSGHWAARYLSIALGLKFETTKAYPNINLDRPATRAEVASMMADAFLIHNDTFVGDDYSDVNASTQYAGAIDALTNDGVLSGDTDSSGNPIGRFRPSSAINRAEVVKIAISMRDRYGIRAIPNPFPSSAYSSSYGTCSLSQCGTQPGMPNWQCSDGSLGGPSCERLPDGRCGWLIRQCLMTSSTSSRSSSSFSSYSSSRSSSHSSSRSSSSNSSRSSSTSSRSSSMSSSFQSDAYDVSYTDNGFQPSFLVVHKGDVVTFTNQSNFGMWVASNPHPTHDDYPELNMHTSVGKDSKFIFTFDKIGTWGYHNHLNSNHQAVIVVESR